MAFEGLTENLKERWAETLAKVQESSAYNTAREQFESQTPIVQKVIIGGGIALAVLFLMSFPMGYLSSSNDNMAIFEENRALIQGLLRASRSAKEAPPLPPPMDPNSLRSMVDRMLHDKKLSAEQIGDMQAIPGIPSKLAPNLVVQNGLAAQIRNLNVTQMIDIANSVNNLGLGIKLIGLDVVQSAGQTHYYDMIIRVVNFGLPPVSIDSNPGKPGGPKGRPARGGSANKDEAGE